MTELTKREQALVHTMFFMMNPATISVPINLRAAALQSMLKIRKLDFKLAELQEFTHAVEAEQKLAIQESFGFLNKHQDLLKGLDNVKF